MERPEHAAFVPTGRRWSYRDTARTVTGGIVLVAGGAIAMHGVPAWEASTFEAINGLPDALYPVIWPIMQIGSVAGALTLAVITGLRTKRLSVGVCAAGAVGTTWVAAKYVKHIVGRDRPFGVGLEVNLRDHATVGLGYVSGHAALTAALYTMVVPHLHPRLRPVAAVLGLTVGFARIYSGAHLPLDVLGGAAMGMIIGEGFRVLEVRWRTGKAPAVEDLTAAEETPAVA